MQHAEQVEKREEKTKKSSNAFRNLGLLNLWQIRMG